MSIDHVPTYIQASKRRVNGLANPLDVFVTNHEPKMYTDIECQEWRQELDKAISWSVNEITDKLESSFRIKARCLRTLESLEEDIENLEELKELLQKSSICAIICAILIVGILFSMVLVGLR